MVKLIASMGEMTKFGIMLDMARDEGREITTAKEYFSPLAGGYFTPNNTKFDNAGEAPAATLLILESKKSKMCYTLAYAPNMDEDIKNLLGEDCSYLASGTGSVGADGNTTNISLALTGATTTNKLRFKNPNIVQITDSSGDDEIYINSEGVNSEATLKFSKGEDTIKFNGATTVQNIYGGVRREYAYSSA